MQEEQMLYLQKQTETKYLTYPSCFIWGRLLVTNQLNGNQFAYHKLNWEGRECWEIIFTDFPYMQPVNIYYWQKLDVQTSVYVQFIKEKVVILIAQFG